MTIQRESFVLTCSSVLFSWGLLLGAAIVLGVFSPLDTFPWLACILLVPLIYVLRHSEKTGILKGLMAGWLFGALSWASGTFWLLDGIDTLMNLSTWQSGFFLTGIWLYQGAPFALFGAVCGWMNRRNTPATPLFCASLLTLLIYLRPALFPVSWAVTAAFWPEFLQISDLGGELLVCFCLVWANCLVSDIISGIRLRDGNSFAVSLLSLIILLAVVLGYGARQISIFHGHEHEAEWRRLSVASVQPAVPVRWSEKNLEYFRTDEAFSLHALNNNWDLVWGADLLVFPELPRFDCRAAEFENGGLKATLERFRGPVLLHGYEDIPALEPAVVVRTDTDDRRVVKHKIDARYSSVFHLAPDKECTPVYRKRIPAPFSESSLYSYLFPGQVGKPTRELGLSRGDGPGLVRIGSFLVQPLICFESGFAHLVREGVLQGADLLVEVSNDGWFFSHRAEMMHLGMSVLRAVEFRRPLVRSSNSGGGAHVMATGEIIGSTLTPHDKAVVTRETLFCPEVMTVFARWGNSWLWGAVLIVFGHLRPALVRSRKNGSAG